MRRRDFTAGPLLAAAAPAWAQPAKRRRIAIMTSVIPAELINETGGDGDSRLLFAELRRLRYVEDRNLAVERHSAEGHPERLPSLAREVMDGKPDLVIALGGPVAHAAAAATNTIPILATFADSVNSGLVASLARPGGNLTGVSVDAGVEIAGKRLQFLKDAAPSASRAAYLVVGLSPESAILPILAEASKRLGMSLTVIARREASLAEYERAFAEMAQQQIEAILINDGGEPLAYRQLIAELAVRNGLPTMRASVDYIEVGRRRLQIRPLPALAGEAFARPLPAAHYRPAPHPNCPKSPLSRSSRTTQYTTARFQRGRRPVIRDS